MTNFFVYCYTHCQSGKQYIGVTNNINRRHKQHASGRSGARAFNNAVKKYGIEAFALTVLSHHKRVATASWAEHATIIRLNTLIPNGYNLCEGAPGTPYIGSPSLATRKKLSQAGMGRIVSEATRKKISKSNLGYQNMLGHHHSEATKSKMSAIAKLRPPMSEETRKKLSIVGMGKVSNFRGHHFTTAQKAQMSANAKLRPLMSEETRKKLSLAGMGNSNNLGHHLTDKQKVTMSVAHTNPSIETRKRMSESMKLFYANKKGKI
jgi:group I intron endonuclease